MIKKKSSHQPPKLMLWCPTTYAHGQLLKVEVKVLKSHKVQNGRNYCPFTEGGE